MSGETVLDNLDHLETAELPLTQQLRGNMWGTCVDVSKNESLSPTA